MDTADREQDSPLRLTDIPLREDVELLELRLPDAEAEPLLERGILPGSILRTIRRSPSGDPIVRVDGVVIALRREAAFGLCVRRLRDAG